MSHGKLLLHRMREVLPSAGLTGLVSCLVPAELASAPLPLGFAGDASGRWRRLLGSRGSTSLCPVCCAGQGAGEGRELSAAKEPHWGFAAFIAAVEGFGPGRIFFFHLASLERIQSSKVLHL